MTYFTNIHTSTCITTSVDLVGLQSFLGFVPRVVVLTVSTTFSFEVLVECSGLRSTFKAFGRPNDFIVLGITLLLLAPKLT